MSMMMMMMMIECNKFGLVEWICLHHAGKSEDAKRDLIFIQRKIGKMVLG